MRVLALDIGGTKLATAVADVDATTLEFLIEPTRREAGESATDRRHA